MKFWLNILQQVKKGAPIVLMYVVQSTGSSPGRQGFKMTVAKNGTIYGSIGGGVMEHKMVELSRVLLKKGKFSPFLKTQIHQANIPDNRSGMICSGGQKIAFYFLDHSDLLVIDTIVKGLETQKEVILKLTDQSFSIADKNSSDHQFEFNETSTHQWAYREILGFKSKVFIIGAGHVGLALSQTMHQLDFHVEIFDTRAQLNTLENNQYAHKKHIIDYNKIDHYIPDGNNIFIVLVSFGYRTDALCIKRLLGKEVRYFGVMGSKAKMEVLLAELRNEGYPQEQLERLNTPIGISIHSKTPQEIAISIAAEIIRVKNELG